MASLSKTLMQMEGQGILLLALNSKPMVSHSQKKLFNGSLLFIKLVLTLIVLIVH
uniref:Uncharacterized protein n=1 Tax=Arundo donax TaxID=35708 RepID=A0A0A9HQY8_ARUDO